MSRAVARTRLAGASQGKVHKRANLLVLRLRLVYGSGSITNVCSSRQVTRFGFPLILQSMVSPKVDGMFRANTRAI